MTKTDSCCWGMFVGCVLTLITVSIVERVFSPPNEPVSEITPIEVPAYAFDDLLDAIEWEESKGITDAVGDGSAAVGAFQIHKIYVDDVNRILRIHKGPLPADRTPFTYNDRLNRDWSRDMVKVYFTHYGGTLEEMARTHVAGPDGWRNDPQWFVRNRGYTPEKAERKIANAKAYWLRIKARMESIRNGK